MNYKEGEPQDEKNRNSGCLRGWELGRGKRALCDGGKVSLDRDLVTQVCAFIKTHQMVYLTFVCFIVCKFYIKEL